jgi:hypothetical protein
MDLLKCCFRVRCVACACVWSGARTEPQAVPEYPRQRGWCGHKTGCTSMHIVVSRFGVSGCEGFSHRSHLPRLTTAGLDSNGNTRTFPKQLQRQPDSLWTAQLRGMHDAEHPHSLRHWVGNTMETDRTQQVKQLKLLPPSLQPSWGSQQPFAGLRRTQTHTQVTTTAVS